MGGGSRENMTPSPPNLIPRIYREPFGLPLYWRGEISGKLEAAVLHYYAICLGEESELSPDDLALLWHYVSHHVNAPCWSENCRGSYDAELHELRVRAAKRGDIAALREYEAAASEIALDPF